MLSQGSPDTAARGAALAPLAGLQVLVVEDEALISMALEGMLDEFGCMVAGTAATVSRALYEIRTCGQIDVAILDVNLGGEKVFPVADLLVERGVPFAFSTGFGPADLAQRYPESELLLKPYGPDDLGEVLFRLRSEPR